MQLDVDTASLSNASSAIEQLAQSYEAEYKKLLTAARSMKGTSWKGKDADTFVAKLDAFEDDFQKMVRLIRGTAKDLKSGQTNYDKVIQEATGKAQRLRSDIS